jgi:hypothetical protein
MPETCGEKASVNRDVCGLLKTEFFFPVWLSAYLVYSDNVHYLRMRALHELSTESYRHDVLSGNLAGYIMAGEY